jgi:hypothetical protein
MSKKKYKSNRFSKTTTVQMKQFVGLVNHDLCHHSLIMKPLHDMIQKIIKEDEG